MLQPKRTKFRKMHKGRNRGLAQRGSTVSFGEYGLKAVSRGRLTARQLEAGTVWINTYKQLSISTPFGGYKDSGIGREKGIGGLRLYQQEKSLYFGLGSAG